MCTIIPIGRQLLSQFIMDFARYSGPLLFARALQAGRERPQLIVGMLPPQNVVQEALDLPRSLIWLKKFLGGDVVGVLADHASIDDNRVSTKDTQYALGCKAI